GGTRTPTVLRPSAPQAGASANSATSALGGPVFFAGQREGKPTSLPWPALPSPWIIPYFFAGDGDFGAGADLPGAVSRIEPEEWRVAQTAEVIEVHMNTPAKTHVILAIVVTAPRGPKAA